MFTQDMKIHIIIALDNNCSADKYTLQKYMIINTQVT